jgi:hypothetical protein
MTKLSSISASLMLLIASAVGSANAQSAQSIKVNIPFAFSFADKTFPAGNYSLFEPLQHFLVLRDARGRNLAQAFTTRVESWAASPSGKLTFHTVDGQNVFSEVWHENDRAGEKLHFANRHVAKHSPDMGQMVEAAQP